MTSATVAAKTAASSGKPEKIRKDHNINWWLTAAVAVLSLTVLVPLYFTVVTALKTPGEAGTFTLPTSWEWHNFADAWNKVNYPMAFASYLMAMAPVLIVYVFAQKWVVGGVMRGAVK